MSDNGYLLSPEDSEEGVLSSEELDTLTGIEQFEENAASLSGHDASSWCACTGDSSPTCDPD